MKTQGFCLSRVFSSNIFCVQAFCSISAGVRISGAFSSKFASLLECKLLILFLQGLGFLLEHVSWGFNAHEDDRKRREETEEEDMFDDNGGDSGGHNRDCDTGIDSVQS